MQNLEVKLETEAKLLALLIEVYENKNFTVPNLTLLKQLNL